ncbi:MULTISPECIES: hypothetical protein [unclassified Microcoleus]|uniref:hypothetical protein n=1 Tax=unclassified Microcoleus TaxID=2642155 RepID=UPI002FD5589A
MDADGERSIALFDAPVDRSFEPQIHTDGRGWGKGDRTFEPQMHADGRGWGNGRDLFLTHRSIALLLTTDGGGLSARLE